MTVRVTGAEMTTQISKNDIALVETVADYRMVTVAQLAVLYARNEPALRRRVKVLSDAGILERLPTFAGQGRGHPIGLFGVTCEGVALLHRHGRLPKSVRGDQVSAAPLIPQSGHQLLVNWCRVHLVHMTREIPRLSIKFFSSNSPFTLESRGGQPVIGEPIPEATGDSREKPIFRPDGIFVIVDAEQEKALLFFLEVDMGTEPVASSRQDKADLAGKLAAYQGYFRSGAYKRYEQVWNRKLNGFRLLLLCAAPARMESLCRLARSSPPSDFVWLTTSDRMFGEGISGKIWVRGGNRDRDTQSILGKLSMQTPISGLATE